MVSTIFQYTSVFFVWNRIVDIAKTRQYNNRHSLEKLRHPHVVYIITSNFLLAKYCSQRSYIFRQSVKSTSP